LEPPRPGIGLRDGPCISAAFCYNGAMTDRRKLTDAEIKEIRRRRPGVRASLACEGIYLAPEEEELFEQMDRERLPPDERAARILQLSRERRRMPVK
jgi:hypothetical protein